MEIIDRIDIDMSNMINSIENDFFVDVDYRDNTITIDYAPTSAGTPADVYYGKIKRIYLRNILVAGQTKNILEFVNCYISEIENIKNEYDIGQLEYDFENNWDVYK